MRKYTALGFLGVGLMASPLLTHMATSAVPSSPKIGAIDVQRTFRDSAAGKRTNATFDTERKAKQGDLDQKKKDFEAARADLEKQKSMLKPDVFQQKQEELGKKALDLQQYANKLDQELAVAEQKALDGLLSQAEPIIKNIAIAEGVQLIVDTKAVVYFDPAMDLTDKLIAQMK
jgi:outer membrane protein